MSFISASLLEEPPLISLFDEPDNFAFTSSDTGNSSGKAHFNLQGSGVPSPAKDLMDLKNESSADQLYMDIYQKNLLKFLATGGFAIRVKDTEEEKEIRTGEPTILSIIDEQDTISGDLEDEQELTDDEAPVNKLTATASPKSELKVYSKVEEEKICSSNEVIELPPSSREGDLTRISQAKVENKNHVYVVEVSESTSSNTREEPTKISQVMAEDSEQSTSLPGKVTQSSRIPSGQDSSEPKPTQSFRVVPGVTSAAVFKTLDVQKLIYPGEDCTTALSDVATSDYLAGESSLSEEGGEEGEEGEEEEEEEEEEEPKPKKRSPFGLSCSSHSPTHVIHTSAATSIRRLVRINLPYDTLHTMQEDSRFDGVCHAWIRRPDFCKFGINCDFTHEYPPVLAKRYGLIAVYIGPDGKEIKNVEAFLKLEDVFVKPSWTKLDQGAKIHSPGCYKEDCRAFLKNECVYGDKCWYRHPQHIVEGGKWVIRDVRKLNDGKHRSYDEPDERHNSDINDRSWRDHSSHARSRMPSKYGHSQAQQSGEIWERTVHTEANISARRLASSSGSGDEGNGFGSDSLEGIYYPGSARIASLATKATTNKPGSAQTPSRFLDTKHTTRWTTIFPNSNHTTTRTKPRYNNTEKNYNYWGDEGVAPDEADYWSNTPPPPPPSVSRLVSREQALVVESMTYDQLFRNESRKETHKEFYRPPTVSHEESVFTLPTKPTETRGRTESRRPIERRFPVTQEKKTKRELIDIQEVQREKLIDVDTSPNKSGENHRKIYDNKIINENDHNSDLNWTRPLETMLAQKCEPTKPKWNDIKVGGKPGKLIEF